jgi:N-methylhydantoinase B
VDVLELRRGDVVTIRTAGAGGYGDPFARDVDAVLDDVRRGLVSVDAAASSYGVVIVDGAVDGAATSAARARPRPVSSLGPERDAYEAVFDLESYDRLVSALFARPATSRSRDRAEVFAAVLDSLPAGFPRVAADDAQIARARTVLGEEIERLRSVDDHDPA